MSDTVGYDQKQVEQATHWLLVVVLMLCIALPLLALAWLGGWL